MAGRPRTVLCTNPCSPCGPPHTQVTELQQRLQSSAQQQAADTASARATQAQQQLDAAVDEAARLRAEAAGLQRQLATLQRQVSDLKVRLGPQAAWFYGLLLWL